MGDTLKIVFRNRLSYSVNLVVDAGLIPADPDLALAPVNPNKTVTLEFFVRAASSSALHPPPPLSPQRVHAHTYPSTHQPPRTLAGGV